jgi:hypothetical protein
MFFDILVPADAAGSFSGRVTFNTNDPNNPSFAIDLRATVNGLGAPRLRIVSGDGVTIGNGATYTFPSTTAGTSVARGFTIYNDGNQPLTISSFTLSGAGYVVRLVPDSTVAPAAITAFRIMLLASSRGTFDGAVTFSTNDPLNPTFTFYLHGIVNEQGSGSGGI